MKRATLHYSKLDDFKDWCAANGYEIRPGKDEFEVLQVRYQDRFWPIHSRIRGDHLTVCDNLMPLVRTYIKQHKE